MYDATQFLDQHPGGAAAILGYAGALADCHCALLVVHLAGADLLSCRMSHGTAHGIELHRALSQ